MTERIASYSKTKALINEHRFKIKKNLGQNFLIDAHVLGKIIKSAEITQEDYIIEIGPGIGGLTQELAEKAGKVTAIEIDKAIIPLLEDNLKEYSNVNILNQDVLKTDIDSLVKLSGYETAKVVANLPYYITTPIIMGLLEKKLNITSLIVMIQKEVASRMTASPGSKDYGSLSLAVQYRAEAYLAANVPCNCFFPRPDVDSAVIKLEVLKEPPVSVQDESLFFEIIKAAFAHRRKTFANCLAAFNFFGFSITKEEARDIIVDCGLDGRVRGENLDINEFCKMANTLKEYVSSR